MGMRSLVLFSLLSPTLALAGEFRAGAGLFMLAPKGTDLQVGYQVGRSPWVLGFRHAQWTDTFHDPFTGRALSDTTTSLTGPCLSYLFRPDARGSWYLEGTLYRWRKRETSLVFGDSHTDATTAPAFGGGYTHAIGRWFYWNAGLVLSPGTKLNTQTSTGSEEDSGTFDFQIQVGVRF